VQSPAIKRAGSNCVVGGNSQTRRRGNRLSVGSLISRSAAPSNSHRMDVEFHMAIGRRRFWKPSRSFSGLELDEQQPFWNPSDTRPAIGQVTPPLKDRRNDFSKPVASDGGLSLISAVQYRGNAINQRHNVGRTGRNRKGPVASASKCGSA